MATSEVSDGQISLRLFHSPNRTVGGRNAIRFAHIAMITVQNAGCMLRNIAFSISKRSKGQFRIR